jgi:tetratricopeptide (TPR) repeat protein
MTKSRTREIPNATIWAAVITAAALIISAVIGIIWQRGEIKKYEQIAPHTIQPMIAAMFISYNDGFYDQAEKLADGILVLDPVNYRAFNMKGTVAFYKGSYSVAVEYFTKALKAVPENTLDSISLRYAYTMNLADSYVEIGGYKLAIDLYKSVSDNSPEWSYGIGRAYMYAGQYSDALKYLEPVPDNNGRGRARVLEAACLVGQAELEHDPQKASELNSEAVAKLQKGIAQDQQYWKGVLTGQLIDVHESHTMARGLLRKLLREKGFVSPTEEQGDCCRQGGRTS